ncbi:uncharacterized protein LOC120071823 isoform X2 [Benincasa hispida]|uniref:uncharacterized protein LOC120071823 isoform X2 n=1 Tax=Benincasa hispida TaxID=102211 RepID=UPI00190239F5|nr:uncharacterized protein LOC120071823 isoform X2 [Benincasa hispida]
MNWGNSHFCGLVLLQSILPSMYLQSSKNRVFTPSFRLACHRFGSSRSAHLKNKYFGTILSSCKLDGNSQIIPLAFAIVDSENDHSWESFFRNLKLYPINEYEFEVHD